MRGMLLVNPKATTTNPRTRDVLIRALGAAVDLSVEETGYRGHATALGRVARERSYDLLAVLGGDGTINEAVNGLLADEPTGKTPALLVIPGGSANVFARALGLPNDPVEATGAVLEALRDERRRPVGLGLASWQETIDHRPPITRSRYFTFCAGLGYDAEVVRAVEGLRAAGYRASPFLYVNTAVRHFFMTDRRHPALRLDLPGRPPAERIFMAIISNTAPWTYAGSRPVNPTPWAGFDTGLDVFAVRSMRLPSFLPLLPQVVRTDGGLPRGRHLVQAHDEAEFTFTADRPVAFQLDGDYLGERESVRFRSMSRALQIVV